MPRPSKRQLDVVRRVRALLTTRGVSLSELSQQTRQRFGGNRLFRIPRNFYDSLRRPSFTPRLHQVYALSVLTGYRLVDWLAVFGFSFDDAVMFQASRRRYRTVALDAKLYDPSVTVSWFEETGTPALGTTLTPLSQWLTGKSNRRLNSLSDKADVSFLYLKIGSRDAYAFPDLLPGSIVRVDVRISSTGALAEDTTRPILAIQSENGIVCGRVRWLRSDRIVLCSRQLAYAPTEFKLGTEARILGRVDIELRSAEPRQLPEVQPSWRQIPLRTAQHATRIGELLRRARPRSGVSFREASQHTAEIARTLRNPLYFCAPGALSDFEVREELPRHIHKLISLSAAYCLSITDLLTAAGLPFEKAGRMPMPGHPKHGATRESPAAEERPSPFLKAVEDEFEEVPFFLRSALPELCGLPRLSIRDFFWTGDTSSQEHPYFKGAAFFVVNRRSKIPVPSPSSPAWAQPLYVLELKGGKRLCAACRLEGTILTVRPLYNNFGRAASTALSKRRRGSRQSRHDHATPLTHISQMRTSVPRQR